MRCGCGCGCGCGYRCEAGRRLAMRASVRAMGNAERVRSCARSAEAWLARDIGRTPSRRCAPACVPRAARGSRRDRSRRGRRPRSAQARQFVGESAPRSRCRARFRSSSKRSSPPAHQPRDDVAAQASSAVRRTPRVMASSPAVDRGGVAGEVARVLRVDVADLADRRRAETDQIAIRARAVALEIALQRAGLRARARVRRRAARSDPCRCTHNPPRVSVSITRSRIASRTAGEGSAASSIWRCILKSDGMCA